MSVRLWFDPGIGEHGMTRLNHFKARCLERGVTCVDLDQLCADLELAIATENQSVIDHVMKVPDRDETKHAHIWRFRVPCGTFYALTKQGNLVTVLTPDQIKTMKSLRRGDAKTRREYNWKRMLADVHDDWNERRKRVIAGKPWR